MKKARWIVGDVLIVTSVFIMSGIESCIWVVFQAAGCLMAGIFMTMDKVMEWLEQDWLYEKGE